MMNRRGFVRAGIMAGSGGILANKIMASILSPGHTVGQLFQQDQLRPDIIFLMCDQQRWDALGINNPNIKTPNLDRLAKSGILYNQATCQAPMCVPSRNSMMFGLYPSQIGVRSNGSNAVPDNQLPVEPLPAMLHKVGYQTAGFGKTHWGKSVSPVGSRGFEIRVVGSKGVGMEQGAIHYQEDENPEGLAAYQRETATYGGGEEAVDGYKGVTSTVKERDHRDGWVAEKCLEFLDSGIDPSRPLFLYLSFLKPHAGLNVPKRFVDLYNINDIPDTEQPPWQQEGDTHIAYADKMNQSLARRYQAWHEVWSKMDKMQRRRTTLYYYANCSWLDNYFGEVLSRLEKAGRLKNALIVFTSDHGDMLGERNFRFTKYCLYDSSVRVPVLLSGSVIPPERRGTIDNRPVELIDLYPTLAEVAGCNESVKSPGLNLLGNQRHQGSFCEFHDAGSPAYMWRTAEWKLILFFKKSLGELQSGNEMMSGEMYDLKNDPHEWNNLYDNSVYREIRERLKTELLGHLALGMALFPIR